MLYIALVVNCLFSIAYTSCPVRTTTAIPTDTTSKHLYKCGNPFDSGFTGPIEYPPDGCPSAYCPIRNSRCDTVQSYDMLACGCVYCNYEAKRGTCEGRCQNLQTTVCLNKVAEPKSDSDCECVTCKRHYTDDKLTSCSGNCYASGMVCHLVIIPDMLPGGRLDCMCVDLEDPDFPLFTGNPLTFGITEIPSTDTPPFPTSKPSE